MNFYCLSKICVDENYFVEYNNVIEVKNRMVELYPYGALMR